MTQAERLAQAAEIIAEAVQIVDRLTAERDALRDALLELLDAGELVWSEADDAFVFHISISEAHSMDIRDMLEETSNAKR